MNFKINSSLGEVFGEYININLLRI